MNKINIEEIGKKINRKDLRSIKKWCKNNDVFLDGKGWDSFAYESNFKAADEKPFINNLKSKFGKDWESVYKLYADGNIPALNMLRDLTSPSISIFKSNSNNENKFIKKLEEYERKKKNAA